MASWGYQLQNAKPSAIANSRFDYMVVDWTSDGANAWSPTAVDQMKAGGARKLLAYVSIGEAESYRTYWQKGTPDEWRPGKPDFVLPCNPEWPDNYPVRFNSAGWHSLVTGILYTVQASGFDGVYLDKVDVYEDLHLSNGRLMAEWVISISQFLKRNEPGFLIFPQNATGLLAYDDYRAAIDGVGREDLMYGEDGEDGKLNERHSRIDSVAELQSLGSKPILAVEYSDNAARRREMFRTLSDVHKDLPSLIPLVTRRALDVLPL